MANRPFIYAFLDRLLSNIDPDYGENPLNLTGLQPGTVIRSKIINTVTLVNGLWQTYLDYKTTRTEDDLDTATTQRWSTDKLAYQPGDSVTVGPGASPISGPVVYYFGGYRVELDECILKPNGADPLLRPLVATPGRVWIYLDVNVIADPGQPFAALSIEDVAAGVSESPGPGQLTLVGLDISATGTITANVYAAIEPDFEMVFGPLLRRYSGLTTFEDTASFINVGGVAISVQGLVEADGGTATAVEAFNDSAAKPTITSSNNSGSAGKYTGDHATAGGLESSNIGAGPSVLALKTVAGVALQADATAGGGTAVEALGGAYGVDATSSGSGVRGTTDVGIGIEARSTSSGGALNAFGGPSPASRAGTFTAGDVGATAVLASTAAAATAVAVAVQGTANGDGTGLSGLASDGYGVTAQSDTSSPKRSSLHLTPQDADPTTPLQGDVHFGLDRGPTGKPRVYTTQHESVHSSAKGWVEDWGLNAAGGPIAGGSGALSACQITPEEVGDVLVVATGHLDFATDATTVQVDLVDATAAVVIATQIERAIDTDGAGANTRSWVIRKRYTLPNTATRTFHVVLTVVAVGPFNYDNTICTVRGVR